MSLRVVGIIPSVYDQDDITTRSYKRYDNRRMDYDSSEDMTVEQSRVMPSLTLQKKAGRINMRTETVVVTFPAASLPRKIDVKNSKGTIMPRLRKPEGVDYE